MFGITTMSATIAATGAAVLFAAPAASAATPRSAPAGNPVQHARLVRKLDCECEIKFLRLPITYLYNT